MRRSKRCRRTGFSLVELMVVVVIIGILATAVTMKVNDYLVVARQNRAKEDIAKLIDAVELWYQENSRYPSNDEGLKVLTEKSAQHPRGLIPDVPIDPWNRPYLYLFPGVHDTFDIFSLGRDGSEGGSGEDADINGWELRAARKAAKP